MNVGSTTLVINNYQPLGTKLEVTKKELYPMISKIPRSPSGNSKKVEEQSIQIDSVSGKKSFGGIPNSRNVVFSQKPSAGNTSAEFPSIKWPQTLLNLTWLCTKASHTFSGTLLNLTLHQSLPEPSPELLWNRFEPNLALHQSLDPRPSLEPSPEPC